MSASNKPRADAVLKNLPKDRQAEIFSRLTEKTATWTDTSLDAVQKWLAADGLKISKRALSEFHSWYSDNLDLQTSNDTIETFEEFCRKMNPDWTAEKVRETAIQFFMAQTMGRKDVGKFVMVATLDQNERFGKSKAIIEERKLKLLEQKFLLESDSFFNSMLKKASELNNSNLSNADKIAAMRKEAFKSVDELQKSGRVKIPKQ